MPNKVLSSKPIDSLALSISEIPWLTHSLRGFLLCYLILSLATAVGLPRQIAALSAGTLYGAKLGFLIATAATISGCMLTFIACRYCLGNWVYQRFPDKTKVIHGFLASSTFTKALTIRILPLGSNFMTNIVAGATNIPFAPYVAGSALGFVPQMVIFSLAGAGMQLAAGTQQQLTLVLTGLALGLMVMLYIQHKRKLQAKKKLSQG